MDINNEQTAENNGHSNEYVPVTTVFPDLFAIWQWSSFHCSYNFVDKIVMKIFPTVFLLHV